MSAKLTEFEQKRLKELEEAFELFNQTSTQLTYAYEALQNQVTDLQVQLARSDQEKKQVADRLEQLLNLLPAGVIVLDGEGKIKEMNPAAEHLLGKDAKGRVWKVVVDNVFLYKNDAGELITHDGQVFQLSTTPLMHSVKETADLSEILLIQDVTPAKELQKHIERHQRLNSMGEMAASLAHQIRTPLAAALLYISQMKQSELPEDKRQKFAEKSLKSLQHLESLVKDMLQYAKGGKVSSKMIQVEEMMEVLEQSVEALQKNYYGKIIFKKNEPGLAISGDQDALQTALQNLINNAIDIVGKEACIEVGTHLISNNRIDFYVKDFGPGVEEALLDKIFEPFYTCRAKGTGLGLAVVRAVAEAHGGEAWVKSIKGHGAIFGIRLPLVQSALIK